MNAFDLTDLLYTTVIHLLCDSLLDVRRGMRVQTDLGRQLNWYVSGAIRGAINDVDYSEYL